MAWTLVKKQGLKSSSGAAAGTGFTTERTATEVYIAISDTQTTAVAAETASAGGVSIPRDRDPHPDDPTRRVKSIGATPDPEGDRKVFIVEVQYSSRLDGDLGPQDPDPLARPDTIDFDASSELKKFFLSEDAPPKPIVTSAGEMFAEFQERGAGVIRLVIEGNRRTVDAELIADYLYPATATNSAVFTVRGLTVNVGKARLLSFVATEQTENATTYLRCRWELGIAPTWDLEIDDRGYHEKDPSKPGKFREIVKGTPPVKVDKPWPLDGKGKALANATDAPAILTFKRYPRKTFGVFGWTR